MNPSLLDVPLTIKPVPSHLLINLSEDGLELTVVDASNSTTVQLTSFINIFWTSLPLYVYLTLIASTWHWS